MRDDSTPRGDEYAESPSTTNPVALRQLPAQPSLEQERQQAEKLRNELHQGNAEALRRVEALGIPLEASSNVRLEDAQFVIAREYGFRSWPRLVDYFTTLERHVRAGPRPFPDPRSYEHSVPWILQGHKARNAGTAQMLGTFVPRFHGATTEQILASDVTIDDARLVVAREYLCPTWEVLVEQPAVPGPTGLEFFETPLSRARYAIRNGDLARLTEIVDANPDLLRTTGLERDPGENLMASAVSAELESRGATSVAITDWLVGRGLDATRAWSRSLIPQPFQRMQTGHVEHALRRGADPGWLPPSGVSLLEHAMYRYWNGEAVDRIAARVTAPDAFWIAAGLGDVKRVRQYLDRNGKPTAAARRHRPDFAALSIPVGSMLPSLPEASDQHVIWEACLVAGYNSRFDVVDLLIDAGFPIDYAEIGITILQFAVQWGMAELAQHLVSRGADANLMTSSGYSARSAAEMLIRHGATVRHDIPRILRICGGDPDAIMRERERAAGPAVMSPGVHQAVHRARQEATHRGRSSVQPEDLLVTLLRDMPLHLFHFFAEAGGDITRVRQAIEARAATDGDDQVTAEVPVGDGTTTVLAAAQALAERHHREQVRIEHLAWALAEDGTGPFATVLGASRETIRRFRARLDQE